MTRLASPVARPVRPSATRRRSASRRRTDTGRVVIYVRVSTEEQAKGRAGLDAQKAECLAYADQLGWTVVEVVTEEAISGKVRPEDRPGFRRALALLDGGEAGTLLVRRADRVSRILRHQLASVDNAARAGWGLATPDGRVDTSTASGLVKFHIEATFAEYERNLIAERTREALAAKKASGVRLGRPSALSSRPGLLARIVAMRAAGETLNAIAAALNAEEIPNPTGSAAGWAAPTISRALRTAALDQAAKEAAAA